MNKSGYLKLTQTVNVKFTGYLRKKWNLKNILHYLIIVIE